MPLAMCLAPSEMVPWWGVGDCSTLGSGSVVGVGGGPTLGGGAMVGIGYVPLGGDVIGALVGGNFSSILCRVFMSCICSSPTVNRDYGSGLLSASPSSSTAWLAVSVEDCFGTGQLCGENSTVLTILSARVDGA